MLDVGNFLAHLRWTARFGRNGEVRGQYHGIFRQEALERFSWNEQELNLREAVCLFRICTNTVRHPGADWRERLATGLSLVNETLSESCSLQLRQLPVLHPVADARLSGDVGGMVAKPVEELTSGAYQPGPHTHSRSSLSSRLFHPTGRVIRNTSGESVRLLSGEVQPGSSRQWCPSTNERCYPCNPSAPVGSYCLPQLRCPH